MKKSVMDQISTQTTKLVLHGTFIVVFCLSTIFIIHDLTDRLAWMNGHASVIGVMVLYLTFAEWLFYTGRERSAAWMLLIFYEVVTLTVLLIWGLGEPLGILGIGFVAILSSVLVGAHFILPIAGLTIAALISIQTIHVLEILKPIPGLLTKPSSFWEVAIYSTIIIVFALVSWLSISQRERALGSALDSKAALSAQKNALSEKLVQQSSARRQSELKQIRELYKFALLGQSAAATIHELSNHLSILNIDIYDIEQKHSSSEMVMRAKESVEHINKMVRQARYQLNSYDQERTFKVAPIIQQSIKDIKDKFSSKNVHLSSLKGVGGRPFPVTGSPIALSHVLSILLNNALDACHSVPSARVFVATEYSDKELRILVSDNGPGIDPYSSNWLFKATASTKPGGLGVGLYVARHLVENQLGGTIYYEPSSPGAKFVIAIPKN